jgi:type I restriction enzyme, S subunit
MAKKQKTKFKQTEIEILPEGWEVKTLGNELVSIKTGKLNSNAEVKNGEYSFFTCAPNSVKTNTYSFDQKAILLAGNNANGNFHLNYFNGKFDAYQRTYVISEKEDFDLKYIYYSLRLSLQHFKEISQGSATKFLTINILNNLKLKIPKNTFEQKAIAHILSTLDEKIGILQKQNKTLEEIGQAIFKKWFVDGKKDDWEIGKLGNLGKIITGKTPPTKDRENYGGEIPFLKIPDMKHIFPLETSLYLTDTGLNTVKNMFLPRNCLNISCIGTLGLVTINKKPLVTNQNINSIIFYRESLLYYTYLYSKKNIFGVLSGMGAGSVFGTVSKSKVKEIPIPIPNQELLNKFHNLIKPLFERIYNNFEQAQTLSKLRESLLPKLMSGKIRVPIK